MAFTIEKKIKSVEEIIKEIPISNEIKNLVEKDRKEIIDIIEGIDDRKILIIGPCSAWPNTALIEYAKKLKEISDEVKDKIKIILRTYTQKPRTNLGWTGPVNQANPYEKADIENGIIYCRKMMIEVLEIGLPISDEALFTHNEGYFTDLLSWVAIGARSSEDQEHRLYASMINHPVGIKNPTSGNLKIGINSIIAAQNSHTFLMNSKQIKSSGNPHSHLILRGGNSKPNLDDKTINESINLLKENNIKFPSIICDASHDNSINSGTGKKDANLQPKIILDLAEKINLKPEFKKYIKGFMVESFNLNGAQNLNNFKSIDELNLEGLSVTDACIGFEETKELIQNLWKKL